jgi:tRNA A-37 threonylcarbamoyl transferase component Bud32
LLHAAEWVAVAGYEVLALLGKGGMGVVYKARQVGLDRVVALKMILQAEHAGLDERERFRAEAHAVASLQHPHIVQIHEVGECQGLPFFSMEFCSAGNLDAQLDGTPWEPQRAARLVEVLARAMQAAHAAGIIHRDLKPANVLLSQDGTPKVTDFGLARRVGTQGRTRSGAVMGTPSYMAPEQAAGQGKQAGPTTDVYALGAILYELLTGRPPFKGATDIDTLLLVLTEEPVLVRRLQPKVPKDLETVCHQCLHKDPARRYSSAAALADDLRRFQAGEPVSARPVGTASRALRWARRRPAVAGLLITVAVVVATGLGGILSTYSQALWERDRADREAANARAQAQRADEEAAKARKGEAEAIKARDEAQLQAEAARTARQETRLQKYVAGIARADDQVQAGNHALANQMLESVGIMDVRGWEYRHLRNRADGTPVTLRWHSDAVRSLSYSPDGSHLVSASEDGAVRVWDTITGADVLTLPGHKKAVKSIIYSPDGSHLASASDDSTVKVWSAWTGAEVITLHGHKGPVESISYSPDGRRLASASDDKTVKIWDARGGAAILTLDGHSDSVRSVSFSPDGRRLASASDD